MGQPTRFEHTVEAYQQSLSELDSLRRSDALVPDPVAIIGTALVRILGAIAVTLAVMVDRGH